VRHIAFALRVALACAALVAAGLVIWEMQTFAIQARQFAAFAARADYQLLAGPSSAIEFPQNGPYDVRLGYARIPEFTRRMQESGFAVERQASFSPRLLTLTRWGISPLYREKTQAGLTIADAKGRTLYATEHPKRIYENFDAIPRILVDSLLFVENRELLDPHNPRRNPAVEWDRLARGALALGLEKIDSSGAVPGGSTLATQIEKYRHSPGGVTSSPREKIRQMITASLRAYRNGDDTTETRRQIVVDYINSVSLAAVPGFGEITGVPEGLEIWYGVDFRTISAILQSGPGSVDIDPTVRARAYKQALSLLLAARRPSEYLVHKPAALIARTNGYLEVLAANGIIPPELRDDALPIKLDLRPRITQASLDDALTRDVVTPVRSRLAGRLGVQNYYDLDRLDLSVESTLDGAVQREMIKAVRSLRDPQRTGELGLNGFRMIEGQDPARIVYSFSLYESLGDRNVLRVQADNSEAAFSVNEFIRLDLGSTAKMRTLVTYLDVLNALHVRYAGRPRAELRLEYAAARDPLTTWAVDRLSLNPNEDVQSFLDAAVERRYSASPNEAFFTGGGRHMFRNFDKNSDSQIMSVEDALHQSVNLVFVRMMRDVAHYYMFGPGTEAGEILADAQHPRRRKYLEEFADAEGRVYVQRYYGRLRGKSRDEAIEELASGVTLTPERLATILRAYDPEAELEPFRKEFERHAELSNLFKHRAGLDAEAIERLYYAHDPQRYTLADVAYLARTHPLKLMVARQLRDNPKASLGQVTAATAKNRIDVYDWLFTSRHKRAQDSRIKQIMEREAFDRILENWRNYGYPFSTITASYASSIGASGDRPAALAELVGIIVNGGRRLPMRRIDRLRFAEGTPYETVLAPEREESLQVMSPAVAATARRALIGVVEAGTARRALGAFDEPGAKHVIGGKTGTGDHEYRTFDSSGREVASHAVSRAGTFVYFIDDRYFGVVTAFVTGEHAGEYTFTSSLPVQLFKALAPVLKPALQNLPPLPVADGANPADLPQDGFTPAFPSGEVGASATRHQS
jgi:membrane peptidoglycan carboxypeptidase